MKKDIKELMLTILKNIIFSNNFYKSLLEINENFFNLKQESHIRNSLLIHLNDFFKESSLNFKAISEHPRINNTRVDLSIVDMGEIDEVFKIEFKFQLVGDYKQNHLIHRHKEITYDFQDKKSDLFILIVIEWNDHEKLAFDNKCGLGKSLINYNKGNASNWRENIKLLFNSFPDSELYEHKKIQISKPYETIYQFYFLSNITTLIH